MVQYTPLTYRQGLVIPSTNPWEDNSDEGVTWAIVPIGSPSVRACRQVLGRAVEWSADPNECRLRG